MLAHRGFLAAPEMVTLPFQLKSQNSGPAGQRQAQRNEYLPMSSVYPARCADGEHHKDIVGGALGSIGVAARKRRGICGLAVLTQVGHRCDVGGELAVGLKLAAVRLVMHRAASHRETVNAVTRRRNGASDLRAPVSAF